MGLQWQRMERQLIEQTTHIALVVPDLWQAEAYYQPMFGMALIGRKLRWKMGHGIGCPGVSSSCPAIWSSAGLIVTTSLQMEEPDDDR